MRIFSLLFFLSICCLSLEAAVVDTVRVHSRAMSKDIKAVVIMPETNKPQSVLYLLHGYSGDHADWVNKSPHIKDLVDRYNYMVVCPDGGYDSWYWDTDDSNYKYETFIIKELIPYVEQTYSVKGQRENRGITGLSMGGHGALYLALRHQDVFAFAGSTSGGVDIRPFANNWSIKNRLGVMSDHFDTWTAYTVMGNLHLIEPGKLKLFIDCGTEDFFYPVNNKLHEELTYMNIDHHYLVMPGKHNWEYWQRSIDYQMAFFKQCFDPTLVGK
ncbi:alpha/beta hydrolase family protein [Sphingobacterium sp. UT-1RO-CII-1]|uniref:alpha/beta hydrolase n=1 Tax=Sphingobacterium sp. UT-1RO-CII-1 TaxID=2995225 RepID=UPI00227D27C5|nr:alpha/beta hydrolase family protein [Sphingobacterium sp. UT-1RO-CII-1]MCY4779699.1 alpha/beta hydrolase family protein [Sphingobacterium sp. UT-1RO-CII-1]